MQLDELKKRMRGVVVVQITPFSADESLDLEGMRANTRWLLEHTVGKDFIFTPMGSYGEFYAMSDEERKDVIKMVVEEVGDKNVVMPGAAHAGTRETIKMCQYAQSVGANGAMVVLPYYHIPEEEGMYQHYKQIAESVDKDFGIMIYNNPGVSGSWIKPPLMARLSKIPNIIAVKEVTPNIGSYYTMRKTVDSKDMVILAGGGEVMFSFGAVYGCPGLVTEKANFAPDLSYSIYEAGVAKDFDKLAELVDSEAPYQDFVSKVTENHGPPTGIYGSGGYMTHSVVRTAMDIVGLRGGVSRLPLVGLNKEEKDELSLTLKTMRLFK